MWSVLKIIGWQLLTGSVDDDWVDRMSHKWTVALLMVATVIVSTGQYVGDPIQCWTPAEFEKSFIEYAKSYCWVANTYAIPMSETIPRDEVKRHERELTYYQYVPFILLLQALLYKLPNIAWHMLNTRTGINMGRIGKLIDSLQGSPQEERDKCISDLTEYLNRWLLDNRRYHRNITVKIQGKISNVFLFCFGRREGHFLIGFYIFTKLLYLVNCIMQFVLLNSFLATNFWIYGYDVLTTLRQEGWSYHNKVSPRFPRVTYCDLDIRHMHSFHKYTVQCVLPINLFNEMIFTFLWFWMVMVLVCTFISFLSWAWFAIFSRPQVHLVKIYLRDVLKSRTDKELCKQFVRCYLRHDGCFLLRIIKTNTTDIMLSDVIKNLFSLYKKPRARNNLS